MDFEKITRFSADIRIQTIRAVAGAGSGHIAGAASIADVLAVLYGSIMKIDPKNPLWEQRDWFVLSKGHCAPALYATLALKGYFPMEWLDTLNKGGTRLPSHADRLRVPGVDMSTGSLGQGISAAVGIAYANRLNKKDCYTYCIVGDGECNEGQVWEACEAATHFELDHLITFVDWNKKQLDGTLEQVSNPVDLSKKFRAFGFETITVDGHNVKAIWEAIESAKNNCCGKPHCIILDTVKGMGIKLAEEVEYNHYIPVPADKAELSIQEIKNRLKNGNYPGGGSR